MTNILVSSTASVGISENGFVAEPDLNLPVLVPVDGTVTPGSHTIEYTFPDPNTNWRVDRFLVPGIATPSRENRPLPVHDTGPSDAQPIASTTATLPVGVDTVTRVLVVWKDGDDPADSSLIHIVYDYIQIQEVQVNRPQFTIPTTDVTEGNYSYANWLSSVSPLDPIFWEVNGTDVTTIETIAGRRALGVRLDGTRTPSTRVGAGARLPPTQSMEFEQWVYFDSDFDWGGSNEGGKLGFGLGGGSRKSGGLASRTDTATQTGFTSRFMWRADGQIEAYVYQASTNGFGDQYNLGTFKAPKGQWFKLKMEVIMNSSAGVADGILRCLANDVLLLTRSDMEWWGQGTPQIDSLLHFTFHGGDDSTWTPSRVNHVYYSDIFYGDEV